MADRYGTPRRGKAPDSDGFWCSLCGDKIPPRKLRRHPSECTPTSPGLGTRAAGGGREYSSSVKGAVSIERDRNGRPTVVSEFARNGRAHVLGRWERER